MNTKKLKENAFNNSINIKCRKIKNHVRINKTKQDDVMKNVKLSRFDNLDSDFLLYESPREYKNHEDSLAKTKKKKSQKISKELLGRKKKKPNSSVQNFQNNCNKNLKESRLMHKEEYNVILSKFRDELFEIIPEKTIQNNFNKRNENTKKFINFIDKNDKDDYVENRTLSENIGNNADNNFQIINTSSSFKKIFNQEIEKLSLNHDDGKINIYRGNNSKQTPVDNASVFSDTHDTNQSKTKINNDEDKEERNFKSEYDVIEKLESPSCNSIGFSKKFFNQNLLIICKNFFNFLKLDNNKPCKMIESILLNNADFDNDSNKHFYKILKEKYSEIYTVTNKDNKCFSDLYEEKLMIEENKKNFYSYLLKNINDFHLYNITNPKIFEIFKDFNRNFNFRDEEDQDSSHSKADGDFHLLKSSFNKNFNYRLNSSAFNLTSKLKKKLLKKMKKHYTKIELDKNESVQDSRVNITLNNSNLSLEENFAHLNNKNDENLNHNDGNLNLNNDLNCSKTSYDDEEEIEEILSISEFSSSKLSDNENQENDKFIEDDFCFTNLNWKKLGKKDNIHNHILIQNNSLHDENISKFRNEVINDQNINKKNNYLSGVEDLNKLIKKAEKIQILENKFEITNEKTNNIPAILNENMFCFPFHEKFIILENLEQELQNSFKKEIRENFIDLVNEDSNKINTSNNNITKEKIENKVTMEIFSKIKNQENNDFTYKGLKSSLDKLKEEGLNSHISSTNFIENNQSDKQINVLNNISNENETFVNIASNIDLKNDLEHSKDNIDFQIDIENDIEFGNNNNSNLIRIEMDEDTKSIIEKNNKKENEINEDKNFSTKVLRYNKFNQNEKQYKFRKIKNDLDESYSEENTNKFTNNEEKKENFDEEEKKRKNSPIYYKKFFSQDDKEVCAENNNIIKIAKSDINCKLSQYPMKDKNFHNNYLSINKKEKLTYRKLLIKKLNFLKKKDKQEVDFKILQDSDILKSLIYILNRKFTCRYSHKDQKLEKSLIYLKENLEKLKLKHLKISINKKYKEKVESDLNGFLNISENKNNLDLQFDNLKKYLLNKSLEDKFTMFNMNNNFKNSLNLNKYFFQKNVNKAFKFNNNKSTISKQENETEEFHLDEIFYSNNENFNIENNKIQNGKEEPDNWTLTNEKALEEMKQSEESQLLNIYPNKFDKNKINNNEILNPIVFNFDKESKHTENLEEKIKLFLQNLDNLTFLTKKASKTDSNAASFVDIFKILYCLDVINEEKNYSIFSKNFSYDNFITNKGLINKFVEEIKKFSVKCRKYSTKKSHKNTNNFKNSISVKHKTNNSSVKRISSVRIHKKGNIGLDFQDNKNQKKYKEMKDENQQFSNNLESGINLKKTENGNYLDFNNQEKNDSTETNEEDNIKPICKNKHFPKAFKNEFVLYNQNNIIDDINKNKFLKNEKNWIEKYDLGENNNKKTSFIISKTLNKQVKLVENDFIKDKEENLYNFSSTDQNNNSNFQENIFISYKNNFINKKEKNFNEERIKKKNKKIKDRNSETLATQNIFDSFKELSGSKISEEKSLKRKSELNTKINEDLLIDKNNDLLEASSDSTNKIQYNNIIKIDTEILNNLNYFKKNAKMKITKANKNIFGRKEKTKKSNNKYNIDGAMDKVNVVNYKKKKEANFNISLYNNLQNSKDNNLPEEDKNIQREFSNKNMNPPIVNNNQEINNEFNFFKPAKNLPFNSYENLKQIDKSYNNNNKITNFEIIGLSKEINQKKEILKLNQNIFTNSEFDRNINLEHETEFGNSNKNPKNINYKNDFNIQSYLEKEQPEKIIEKNSEFQNYKQTYLGFQKKNPFKNSNKNVNFVNEFNKFDFKAKLDDSIIKGKDNLNFQKPIASLLSNSVNLSNNMNLKENKNEKPNLFFTNDKSNESDDCKAKNDFKADFIKSNNSFDFVQKNLKIPNMNLNLNFNLNVNLNVNLNSKNEKEKNSKKMEPLQYLNEASINFEDRIYQESTTGKDVNINNFTNIYNNTTNNYIIASANDSLKDKKFIKNNHNFSYFKNHINRNENNVEYDLNSNSNVSNIFKKNKNMAFGSGFLTNSQFELNQPYEKQQSLLGLKRNCDSFLENKSNSGDNFLDKQITNFNKLIGKSDVSLNERQNKYLNFPNYNNPNRSSFFNLNNVDKNNKNNKPNNLNFDSLKSFKTNILSESARKLENDFDGINSFNYYKNHFYNNIHNSNINNIEFKNLNITDDFISINDPLDGSLLNKSKSNKTEGINIKNNNNQFSSSKKEKNKNCLYNQNQLLNDDYEKTGTVTDSLSSDDDGENKNKNVLNNQNNESKETYNKTFFSCKNEGLKNFTDNGVDRIPEKKETNKDLKSEMIFKNYFFDLNNNSSSKLKIPDLARQINNNYLNRNKDYILNKNNTFTNLILNKNYSEEIAYPYDDKKSSNLLKLFPNNLAKSLKSNTQINNDNSRIILNQDSSKFNINVINSTNRNNQIFEKNNFSSSDLLQSNNQIVYKTKIYNNTHNTNNTVNIFQTTKSLFCKDNSLIFSEKNFNNCAVIPTNLKKAENSETNDLFKNFKNTNSFNLCSLNNNKINNPQYTNKFLNSNNLNSGDQNNTKSEIHKIDHNVNKIKNNNAISPNLSNFVCKIQSPLKKEDEKDKKLSEFNLDDFFVYDD